MDLGLKDLCVWITGASGGIGRDLAAVFLDEGARCLLHARSRGNALRRWVEDRGAAARTLVVEGDVTRAADLEAMVAAGAARFGRVDVCVVNAGVWPAEDVPLVDLPEARIREVLDVNLVGALLTCRAFLRGARDAGVRADGRGTSIVLIGSTAGVFGERGHVEYSASKAALRGVLLSLKNELPRIDPAGRVNLVDPGWTVTEMTADHVASDAAVTRTASTMALRRLATPADVARTAAFLASPAAAHLTGQTLVVAGGMEGRRLWEPAELDAGEIRKATRADVAGADPTPTER